MRDKVCKQEKLIPATSMIVDKQPVFRSFPWFKLALVGIFLFSLGLRFWRLEQFNTLVFDEVYYPVFANRYLLGETVYNTHPPLSQLILAVGIWLGSHLPFGQETTNTLTGSLRTTFSYRWFNALTGSFVPVVIGAIAYLLTYRRSYGAIAALFAALDGLFLVESRYGLNNIYLVLFGLLGQLCVLFALQEYPKSRQRKIRRLRSYRGGKFRLLRIVSDRVNDFFRDRRPRWQILILAGIFFGLSAGIKWNGLGFLLGIYLLWFVAWAIAILTPTNRLGNGKYNQLPLTHLTSLNLLHIIWYLGCIPVFTYCLTWVPHLLMNPKPGFWEMQKAILSFHQKIGSGPGVHPYCSSWYSWLIMGRPVAYFYQKVQNVEEMIPAYPPLPSGMGSIVYDVHAMGNPILWWFSTLAIAILCLFLLLNLWRRKFSRSPVAPSIWLMLFLVFNYAANLLPWLKVTRCTFLYHYMGASVFAILAGAWIIDNWLHSSQYISRQIGLVTIIFIILAFIFWLPIYLGLPLSPDGYQLRMWFNNWV